MTLGTLIDDFYGESYNVYRKRLDQPDDEEG
jgi:hypothetical protein